MDFVTSSAKPGDPPIRGYVPGKAYRNDLPITTLAVDRITFPVEAAAEDRPNPVQNPTSKFPEWMRWNDYGIGLFLKGKAELRQAADAFAEVEKLDRYDGPLNLARVLEREGRLTEAVNAIKRAQEFTDPPAPRWTIAWLSGVINRQEGHLVEAERNLRSVLEDSTLSMRERHFDFSLDYKVINLLGQTLFDRARQERGPERQAEKTAFLKQAVQQFQKTLEIDSENVTAHYNLQLLYAQLGDREQADQHRELHAKFKPDDNARDRAVQQARRKYPAANQAAEALVIYRLHRPGAPELEAAIQKKTTQTQIGAGQ
jgi:tetratricopeptide (TPR) repeat protein